MASWKLLHLYTGQGYPTVTTSTMQGLIGSNVNGVVIHLGASDQVYFDYQKSTANRKQVIDQMISDLRVLLKAWDNSNWGYRRCFVSMPALSINKSTYDNVGDFYADYKTYMSRVKDTFIDVMGQDVWDDDVVGFYFRTETILPITTEVSRTNPTSHKMVKLLNDLSYVIHNTYEKEFLWCPYYGYGSNASTVTKNMGVVANRTNIFDYILIQPQYYFQGSQYKQNVDRVYDSVINQVVIDENGNEVAGGRTSSATALIGVNMEADERFNTTKKTEFKHYVDTFKPLVGKRNRTFVFYADNTHELVNNRPALFQAVKDFYN